MNKFQWLKLSRYLCAIGGVGGLTYFAFARGNMGLAVTNVGFAVAGSLCLGVSLLVDARESK